MLFFITFILVSLSVVSASDVTQDTNMTDSVTSTSTVEIDYENSNTQSNVIENDTVSSNDMINTSDNTSYNNNQVNNTEDTTTKQIIKTNNATIKTDSDKISSTIIIDEILFAGKDNSVNISAVIKDQYGRTINSGKVAFKVSGITIDTVNIVNSKASVIYPATNLTKEYYVFNVVYGGSRTIEPCRVNTTLKVLSKLSEYSFSQIGEAATRVKTFIETYKRIPNYITVGSDRIDPEDYLYMLTRTISDKSSVANGYFSATSSVNNTNCSGVRVFQDEFLSLANNIVSYYARYKTNPSSVTAYNSTVSYQDTVYLFTRIVAYTYNYGSRPNYGVVVDITGDKTFYDYENTTNSYDAKQYVDITLDSYESYPNTTKTISATFVYGNSTKVNGVKCVFKVNALTVGTTTINDGVATLTFDVPNWGAKDYTLEVKIGETSNSYQSSAQSTFTVLSTKTTDSTDTSTSTDTSSSTKTYGTNIILDEVYFAKSTNNQATIKIKVLDDEGNSVTGGKSVLKINDVTMDTQTVNNGIATFTYDATDLSTVKTHDVDIIYGGTSKYNSSRNSSYLRVSSTLYKFTYEQVLKAANNTKTYIEANNKLPNNVTIGNYQVSMVDYLYLLGQTVTSNTSFYSPQFSSYTPTTTTNCYGKNLSKAQFIEVSNNYIDSLIKNAKLPSKFTNDVGNISFTDMVYLMTRAVAFMYNYDIVPAYSMILQTVSSTTDVSGSISGNAVSDSYKKYLAITKNCEVNSSYIKNALSEAIKGVSGTLNQAKAIFNYVNNKVAYSYYYNTRYGAIKTLSYGYGNCVDSAHALIAMYRTANIPARYVHGASCRFRSGLVTGHVWAEVYIGGTWYKCDASSNYNSFNNIVNWNGNSGEVRYIELPF